MSQSNKKDLGPKSMKELYQEYDDALRLLRAGDQRARYMFGGMMTFSLASLFMSCAYARKPVEQRSRALRTASLVTLGASWLLFVGWSCHEWDRHIRNRWKTGNVDHLAWWIREEELQGRYLEDD